MECCPQPCWLFNTQNNCGALYLAMLWLIRVVSVFTDARQRRDGEVFVLCGVIVPAFIIALTEVRAVMSTATLFAPECGLRDESRERDEVACARVHLLFSQARQ